MATDIAIKGDVSEEREQSKFICFAEPRKRGCDAITADIEVIKHCIHEVRGMRVMLDRDLAELYGVGTRVLNQAVKRNIERFPADFMFLLNKSEWEPLRSQIVTLKRIMTICRHKL